MWWLLELSPLRSLEPCLIAPKTLLWEESFTKWRAWAFGSGSFCLVVKAPVDVVAAGAVTIEASEAFPDGSKDLTLEGVSSIDLSTSLLLVVQLTR